MRILVTNDDGRNASGLLPLVNCLKRYGDVFVCVPKYEQSGMSHGIKLHSAFECKRELMEDGTVIWTVDSTPADCVRFAILGLHEKFDIVISGINRGYNMGSDIMYSGTVSAATEGINLGIKALALSTSPEYYDNAVNDVPAVIDHIFDNSLLDIHNFYNVNIPKDNKGFRFTSQGGPYYSDDFIPIGNDMYMPTGKCVYTPSPNDNFDCDAVMDGYISITPLTANKTDIETLKTLMRKLPDRSDSD